jgi:hypothetical protein
VSDFLTRWNISRMMEQDRQVTRPDIVIDMDHIAQTSHAQLVPPAPAAFRLTATTATAADPRPSSSTTYSTVFSGYVPCGLHTVSSPAVDAPWTSVSTSYAPYDLCTKHFLSLRVIKGMPATTGALSSDSGRNISSVITCQSQDRVELELDSLKLWRISKAKISSVKRSRMQRE